MISAASLCSGVAARGDHPVEGYRRLAAPEAGYVEQVFEHGLGERHTRFHGLELLALANDRKAVAAPVGIVYRSRSM